MVEEHDVGGGEVDEEIAGEGQEAEGGGLDAVD